MESSIVFHFFEDDSQLKVEVTAGNNPDDVFMRFKLAGIQLHQEHMTVVDVNSITVADHSNPANNVTSSSGTSDLYICEPPSGNVSIDIGASIAPAGLAEVDSIVLWKVETIPGFSLVAEGNFNSGNPSLALLDTSGGDREFKVSVGCDRDLNGELDTLFEATHCIFVTSQKVELDIIHPATGEVSDSDEESPGGLVAIKENANTPVTELLLRNIEPIAAGGDFKLIFSPGNFKIWLNSNGTNEVLSNSTTISATTNTTLYLEGISESSSLGAEQIEVVWTDGATTLSCGERVHLTVVEAEFDVVHRVFIPYNWVDVPHPAHLFHVAEGDDRSFDSTLSGTFRVEQRMLLIPFEELASNLVTEFPPTPGNHKTLCR